MRRGAKIGELCEIVSTALREADTVGIVQYDAKSTMSMRIQAAWMMSRRDEYDVDEDTGGVDDSK